MPLQRIRRQQLLRACEVLVDAYPVQGWWPARSRFEVMIGAVLVQNTRWSNVVPAIAALRRAGCTRPKDLARTPPRRLAALIRPAGCQRIKARRLLAMAQWVVGRGGLRALSRLATADLRTQLLTVHGIGPETADAILSFAFARPVFVADRYAQRWLTRLGALTRPGNGYLRCRKLLEATVADARLDLRDLHAAVVLHAQTVCKSRPDCSRCAVEKYCNKNL